MSNKTLTKVLSFVLAVLLLATALLLPSYARTKKNERVPLVVVTGFGLNLLYYNYGEADQKTVWPFSATDAAEQVKLKLPSLIQMIIEGKYTPERFGTLFADGSEEVVEKLVCNPDGTSKYNVTCYPNIPEKSTYKYLKNKMDLADICEPLLAVDAANKTGEDNVFVYHYDFRMGAYKCARELRTFIEEVKEYTGAKRINLFGMSFGGLITGTYLSLYGTKGDLKNVIMDVPALGGTSFISDYYLGESDIPLSDIIQFVETGFGLESHISDYIKLLSTDELNKFLSAFLKEFRPITLYWNSMWDLMTNEDYEKLKPVLLDKGASAKLIEESDFIHHKIVPNYRKNFKKCLDKGVNVSILCNYGNDTFLGDDALGDILLDTEKVSGAKCAPYGKRFADGYVCANTVCKNKSHYHVSPSMEIDASCAYLPENTWFIDGQYHGSYSLEKYSLDLVKKLVYTDKRIDIYSDANYPQFEVAKHQNRGVYAKFDDSLSGYLTGKDKKLEIENLSKKYPIKIMSVTCDGADIAFDEADGLIIPAGKTKEVTFTGKVPKVGAKHITVTVKYFRIGSVDPIKDRTLDFTIRNGAPVKYSGGYVDN
ncbi:MAG: hypothetical protein K6F09_04445 [Clostridiales bacterium]|nr:hypothetical protein [Clostridiales bacterium]